ncbi:MAG: hypothetical protein JWN29_4233 [Acidimicrobiales bacterium]|nr:hypothetical protein [Acidimicrobiales bacterium]
MTTARRSRRIGASLVAAGLVCGGGAVAAWQAVPASAADELQSFELSAVSHGAQVLIPTGDSPAVVEGDVPQAEAQLAAGPIGRGLASIAWPGPTVANGGSLLSVVAPQAPKEASQLNYPVRAESRTGETPSTKTLDGPGFALRSTSLADLVESDAHVQSANSGLLSLGAVNALARSQTTDGGGMAEATSSTQNISIAGVLKIQSITSTATAKSAGDKGEGDGKTVVSGVTVAEQPATIDENGLHLAAQPATPLGGAVNQGAEQALKASGITVTVTKPEKEINGASVATKAGVVVIGYKTDQGPFTVTFGGAAASAQSAPGFGDLFGDFGGAFGGDVGAGPVGLDAGTGSFGDLGTTPVDAGTAPAAGGRPVALGPIQNAASRGKPVKAGALLLAVLGAGLLAVGLRRLGDNVLMEQAGTTCPLDGEA